MCNYKYTSNYEHLHRSIGKECPYTKIYSELKNNEKYNFENITSNLELPLDSHGICIFHSNELEWKRKNNFTIKFLELLQFLAVYTDSKKYYDFAEFVFVGEYPKSSKDVKDYIFSFTNFTLNKAANFTGALFVDRVEFDLVKFNEGANFGIVPHLT